MSFPLVASASIFSFFSTKAQADSTQGDASSSDSNSQKIGLGEVSIGPGTVSGEVSLNSDPVEGETALFPSVGPSGSVLDVSKTPDNNGQVSVYTVHAGDTIAQISKMFGVTSATILTENGLTPGKALKEGTNLIILPISGFVHTVKKGETISSIAKKNGLLASDVAYYNDMMPDDMLSVGDEIIIPDEKYGNSSENQKQNNNGNGNGSTGKIINNPNKPDLGNYFLRPIAGGRRTQGLHGKRHTGVDIGAPIGTPILAAADGVVIIAQDRGYNTGYGDFVAINHNINGRIVQTLYAHMSKVIAEVGQSVHRGDVIGLVGSTGRSSGAHLHFEVNGAVNPIGVDPDYGL